SFGEAGRRLARGPRKGEPSSVSMRYGLRAQPAPTRAYHSDPSSRLPPRRLPSCLLKNEGRSPSFQRPTGSFNPPAPVGVDSVAPYQKYSFKPSCTLRPVLALVIVPKFGDPNAVPGMPKFALL